jgi:hypothetical protein
LSLAAALPLPNSTSPPRLESTAPKLKRARVKPPFAIEDLQLAVEMRRLTLLNDPLTESFFR